MSRTPTAKKSATKSAKKAGAKTAQKAVKKTPIAPTSAESPAPRSLPNANMIMVGALVLGGIAGAVTANLQSSTTPKGFDASVESYIRDNPQTVLNILREASVRADQDAKKQAINLVRADDGKTIFGNPDGDVTIYEFSDYNCGYCKRSYADLLRAVEVDGNIRVVVKELPILSQTSLDAAMVSLAAAEFGKYPEVHDALMTLQGRINNTVLDEIIASVGLDKTDVTNFIARPESQAIIEKNRELAGILQVNGTPAFVIGNEFAPGAISFDDIMGLVKRAREEKS